MPWCDLNEVARFCQVLLLWLSGNPSFTFNFQFNVLLLSGNLSFTFNLSINCHLCSSRPANPGSGNLTNEKLPPMLRWWSHHFHSWPRWPPSQSQTGQNVCCGKDKEEKPLSDSQDFYLQWVGRWRVSWPAAASWKTSSPPGWHTLARIT